MEVVRGQVGYTRYKVFVACFTLLIVASLACCAVLPLLKGRELQAAYLTHASVILVSVWLFTMYNMWVDGPRRCFDISEATRFELNTDWLSVSLSGSHKWRRYPSGSIISVRVYKQPFKFGFAKKKCRHGDPEIVERIEDVQDLMATTATSLALLAGGTRVCHCAFLAAEILGESSLLPLSRRVWCDRAGLMELFNLAEASRGYRDKRIKVIEALPTFRLPAEPAEADLEQGTAPVDSAARVECSICLEVMEGGDMVCRLPCGHTMHESCIKTWLLHKTVCPLCKECIESPRSDRAAEDPSLGRTVSSSSSGRSAPRSAWHAPLEAADQERAPAPTHEHCGGALEDAGQAASRSSRVSLEGHAEDLESGHPADSATCRSPPRSAWRPHIEEL